jgi:hypothetical protein
MVDEHVEVTVRLSRGTLGLALTADEARRLSRALEDAARAAQTVEAARLDLDGLRTLDDLVHASHDAGLPPSAVAGAFYSRA